MAIEVVLTEFGEIAPSWASYHSELGDIVLNEAWLAIGRKPDPQVFAFYDNERLIGHTFCGDCRGTESITQFRVEPHYVDAAVEILSKLILVANPEAIVARTDSPTEYFLLQQFCASADCSAILFRDGKVTHYQEDNAELRLIKLDDLDWLVPFLSNEMAFPFHFEVLETIPAWIDRQVAYALFVDREFAGIGAAYDHYTHGYVDVGMTVKPEFRGKGLGRWVVQELKKMVYASGRVPTARCAVWNDASRKTLEAAGFVATAREWTGKITNSLH